MMPCVTLNFDRFDWLISSIPQISSIQESWLKIPRRHLFGNRLLSLFAANLRNLRQIFDISDDDVDDDTNSWNISFETTKLRNIVHTVRRRNAD